VDGSVQKPHRGRPQGEEKLQLRNETRRFSVTSVGAASHQGMPEWIGARLDRLPVCWAVWKQVVLLSLSGFFEFYELFSTAYIAPGIERSGILTTTTATIISVNGMASFIAALFAGLFLGTVAFGRIADRYGRRSIFAVALLWYAVASLVTAFQHDAWGLNFWRFVTGIGLGVEMVTIDAYISELVPKHMRGRAFACNQAIQFAAVPCVALLAWSLVPSAPFGIDGWRWVVLIGGAGALPVWLIRSRVGESPRWLAQRGFYDAADRALTNLETQVVQETGVLLPPPMPTAILPQPADKKQARFRDLWSRRYAPRTVMLIVFHLFQTVALYGFTNWAPSFLIKQGITVTVSLGYSLGIALVSPIGPLLGMMFADKVERKWQIMVCAILIAVAGVIFGEAHDALPIMLSGSVVTLGATVLAFNFHVYQAELYPTEIRALAVGFVYSWSRLSGILSGFLIAAVLRKFGVPAVFALIAGSMVIITLTIGLLGPKTTNRSLESIAQ
jgi:MFS transporter, putative metabolite:H+ symporter